MKKSIFLLLIFVFGIFLLPTVVFAEGPTIVVVVDSDNKYNLLEGDTVDHVTYDSSTSTLTIDNFVGDSIVVFGVDLTVVLKGENRLSGNYKSEGLVLTGGKFTIKGNGSLTIDPGEVELEIGIISDGSLTIDSGTINITGADAAIYSEGTLEINDGEINITDSETGIYYDGEGAIFKANGGKINISDVTDAVVAFASFVLDGADIVIDNVRSGINSGGLHNGYTEINKGSIVFKNMSDGFAFAVGYELGDATEVEEIIKVNSDVVYVDSDTYDFRVVEFDDGYVLVLAEEGIATMDEEGMRKLAKNVTVLSKEEQAKTYEITEGDKQKIRDKAGKIRIDADLDKFVALYIDDELVNEENYELEEGSTIIKLKDEYIKKLSAGTYKFKAVFNDGTAEGTFEITGDNPNTSDNIIISIIMLVIASLSLILVRKRSLV